ncbi:MAG: hypothetical protein A2234_06090 [Elusimicrobia bacterium RIFOXYA2_FULL_58_8]|nr:MAG: hypothetical protein A2285_04390 [Elusimicrobia bacterium RIFOXYA12_FULL_57_11]OGS17027.1 MAG: hypothetical protein A2234_06090 [Elusimicrobia bacterium RIFOXYA2_FULL_58_8]
MQTNFKKLWLVPAIILSVFSPARALSAVDALTAKAGGFEFHMPAPPEGRLANSPLSPVRTEWLNAARKYSDWNFIPPPQRRVDTNGSKLVMLQGFHWHADSYWYHPPNGWWGVVAEKAAEIGRAGFDLVWLPPVSRGSYYPTEWYNLDSQWGTKANLLKAVGALHASAVKVVADVVINHRNGTRDWADFTSPDWPTTVIARNDEWPGSPKSQYDDEGQGEVGCRDLDHRSRVVQDETKIFLRWLKNDIGFDGWRYDMVKGYPAHYTQLYNEASSPIFSVGEFYDGNRQLIADWIDGTDNSSSKTNASTAFDFTTRYAIIAAVESERYEGLNDNGRPSGLIGWWPAKSVTYVESHDTSPRDPEFLKTAPAEYKAQRLMGYAYILTHPGIPCVFWPHYFDWGQAYKHSLQTLVNIRKTAGITSTSRMGILAANNELYAAVIDGDSQRVILKLGRNGSWQPGAGWTLATSGERYAVWTQQR